MRAPKLLACSVCILALGATAPAAALDPEFEALRAAARKHEAEKPKTLPPATTPAKPAGPSLAKFIPPAPKGWRMRNNPFDDAEGLVDLTRQASVDYVQTSGARGPALEITILTQDGLIGGGVPKLGKDPYSGAEISQVQVAGHTAYLSWQASSRSGKLSLSIGRRQVLITGREVTPQLLSQLAASVDLARLKTL